MKQTRAVLRILLSCGFAAGLSQPQSLSPSSPAREYIRVSGQVIALENAVPASGSSFAGSIDHPAAGATALSGTAIVDGWVARTNATVTSVSIAIDAQPFGTASYGVSRPDICQSYPTVTGCPAPLVGWTSNVNTTLLTNGPHTLTVTFVDSSSTNPQVLGSRPFSVLNQVTAGGPVTDQFNETSLNTSLWTKLDAIGDGSATVTNGHLQISTPGTSAHDAYTNGNNGVEIVQSIADVDFQVEAKFDSTPANGSEGIMALQDSSTFVRCDVASNNDGVHPYSGYIGGSNLVGADYDSDIGSSSSYWLRLSRSGTAWTCSVSTDGVNYDPFDQFTQAMTVAKIGLWAGNSTTASGLTAQADYFSAQFTNQATGLQTDQFNGASLNSALWVKHDAIGDGSASVANGHLQIAAPAGATHDSYTNGNNGVEILQSVGDADFQVEAKFDSMPVNGSEGIMVWQDSSTFVRCDVASNNDGVHPYSAYIGGSNLVGADYDSDIGSSPSYWLRLSRSGTAWACSVSTDGVNYNQFNQFTQAMTVAQIGLWAGNNTTAAGFTAQADYFSQTFATFPGLQTDEFGGASLNTPLWTKLDAVGDGSAVLTGGHLQITAPAGTSHDSYTNGNNGVEIVQTMNDVDFQVEAKFDSTPANGSEGIMALQDSSTFVRCDVASNNDGVHPYSAYIGGSNLTGANYASDIGTSSSYWLRLSRSGSTWSCSVSKDGTNYTLFNQFTQAMTVTQLGLWAGNSSASSGFTAQADYFSNIGTN